MRCPKCKSIEDRVIDSRPVNHCSGIRRRRVCLNCEYRFTTYEQIERADLLVIKRVKNARSIWPRWTKPLRILSKT